MADSPANWSEMLKVGAEEHKRALNRARQQRYRNARNGKVTLPDQQVTKRLHSVAQDILMGESQTQSLVKNGFAHSSVQVIDTARSLIVEEMKTKGISREMVYESIVRRNQATKPVPAGDTYIDAPDWQAQSAACRDAIALLDRAGELPQAQQSQAGSSITVNILNYHAPQDVVSEPALVDITQPQIADTSMDTQG